MAEWPLLSLREANVELIDCDHRTPPASKVGYPYVAIPQLREGHIEISEARRITAEHYLEWTKKARPTTYDVVLSRRCNPGETAVVDSGMEFALGQNLVLLRANGTKVYPPFLRWLVRGPEWWEQVNKFINVGAVFDSLKCAEIPSFRLRIPSLPEQRMIAHILGALDHRIELNRRMNETLDAIARAIFKSWFVDFDPVHAKAEGRQPFGIGAEIAALFPDSFQDSSLGIIPKGWRIGALEEMVVLQRGFDLPTDSRTPGQYPVISASGTTGTHNEWKAKGPGLVTGRSGLIGKVFYIQQAFWPLNTTLWVKEFRKASPTYAFHLLERLDFGSFNAGSAVPTLNRNHVHTLPVVIPDSSLIAYFEKLVSSMYRAHQQNEQHSLTLASIRDIVLPKLISGEIRLNAANGKHVEKALV